MGYWKDNFPGSEAYFLRIKVAKSVVAYTLVVGGLLMAFSPLANTLRKELEQGQPQDPEWLRVKLSRKLGGGNIFSGIPTKENFDKILETKDRELHFDWTRPKELRKELFEREERERKGLPDPTPAAPKE